MRGRVIFLDSGRNCIFNNTMAKATGAETIAGQCLGLRVRVLNRVLSSIYDDALRPCGLKVSQLTILVVIANRGTVRPADIGALIHMDNSTLSRNLERIRRQGWIEIAADDSDARAHPVRLTGKGRKVLECAIPRWEEAQGQARARLGDEGAGALHSLAERLMEA